MSAEARPQPESLQKAKKLFTEGETQYRLGNFAEALAKYRAALKVARRPSIILNIAQCYRQLDKPRQAIFFYKLYISDWQRFKPGTDPPYLEDVTAFIRKLNAKIEASRKPPPPRRRAPPPTGALRLTGLPLGSTVIVGGEVQISSSDTSATIELAPGTYGLRIEAEGYLPWNNSVTIEPDLETSANVELDEVPRASLFWMISGISTAALAVAAEVAAITFTVQANQQFKGTSKFKRYAGLAIGSHITAAVMAVASGVSWWLYIRSIPSGNDAAQQPALSLIPVPTPSGFAVAGRWRF